MHIRLLKNVDREHGLEMTIHVNNFELVFTNLQDKTTVVELTSFDLRTLTEKCIDWCRALNIIVQ